MVSMRTGGKFMCCQLMRIDSQLLEYEIFAG